ncbi:MAG TPA: hypothetical protein VG348_15760, partial [Acidimicrobiia bacterium]|nr:hypothetical protein [Acidimicrobiia bacterium]
AIGDGIVTQVTQAGDTGWTSAHPGGFVEYQIQGGGLNGLYIYHAEGIVPTVTVGQKIKAGDRVANLIPGWPTGTESGFGSGTGESTYAAGHGGYQEGQMTAAGQAMSDLIAKLGGPAGLTEGRTPIGTTPFGGSLTVTGEALGTKPVSVGGLAAEVASDVISGIWDLIGKDIEIAALYVAFVLGAVWLIGKGIEREVGANPVTAAAHAAGDVGRVGLAGAAA